MPRRVGLLAVGPDADAAWTLLAGLSGGGGRRVALNDLARPDVDVLWVHATVEPPPLPQGPLASWLRAGGRLLLTQRAASLVASLGVDDQGPNDVLAATWAHAADELWFPEFRSFGAFPHIRGIAAYGPHPLFVGLGQGTYLWAPAEGEPYVRATYERGQRPARGRVVGCERSYIHLNGDRIVAWEYDVGAGGVLCVGAFIAPAAPDRLYDRQLRALLRNALLGDGIPAASRTGTPAPCYWPVPGTTARADPQLALPAPLALDGALPGLDSPLHVGSRALSDEAFTLAGRRVLVVGGEQVGVREIWTHPHRALKHLTVSVGGEAPLVRDVQITPAAVQRHLVSRQRIVAELITTALEQPLALLEYRSEKVGRARSVHHAPGLLLQWMVDLRRMWPYDAGCGGDLRYVVDPDGTRLLVADGAGGGHVFVQTNQPVEWIVKPVDGVPALHCTVAVALEQPLRLMVLGGASREDLETVTRAAARRGVSGLTGERRLHETQVREQLTRLASPDARLNAAFEWAKVRLDASFVDTPPPGIGRAMVGGYAASRPGWGDGRPGYAWYFGRDNCWSGFALLAAGDFSGVRLALRFLGDTQDTTGKVIHEYTTSGLAHYDAADSTPLYLLLAGRYAAWSGDLEFLETQWPRLEAAYRFCLETDGDGDGLIENTRVGHGWIEMGPLSGSHVTLYLAAIWIAALEALAPVARALNHTALGAELVERGARARAAVAARFLTPDGYALGLLPDGTPQQTQTALTAVALLLDAVDPAPAARWLDAVAGDGFSTPWGVRLLSKDDPLYNPAGYHTGTVWPLYTGWTSLAEYACGRSEAAFRHLETNARLPFARAIGAFDEVLHGHVEMAAGICPDQCWSAAMLVSPVIEGLLGARPDALEGHLLLAPRLPAAWRDCEWRDLHVGRTSLDVRVSRREDRIAVRLRRTAGRRLHVTVAPGLPAGRVAAESSGGGRVSLDVSDEHTVEIRHRRA